MSIIAFDPARALLHRLAVADPAELPVLQREACALLRLAPPEPADLTAAERRALAVLGRRQRHTRAVALELSYSQSYTARLLGSLRRKGYALRVGHYITGGWVKTRDYSENTQQEARAA